MIVYNSCKCGKKQDCTCEIKTFHKCPTGPMGENDVVCTVNVYYSGATMHSLADLIDTEYGTALCLKNGKVFRWDGKMWKHYTDQQNVFDYYDTNSKQIYIVNNKEIGILTANEGNLIMDGSSGQYYVFVGGMWKKKGEPHRSYGPTGTA